MQNAPATDYCEAVHSEVLPSEILHSEVLRTRDRKKRRRAGVRKEETVGPWCYLAKVGRGTIRLTAIEYRILMFLASRPYHAFSRRRIADAVSTKNDPVPVDKLSHYVHSLRRQLGFYGDYIQSVPYIGYRFKA